MQALSVWKSCSGPALLLADARAKAILLFKPQFQVGPANIGKGGIVSNMQAVTDAQSAFEVWMEDRGWPIRRWTPSPIRGGDGNAEILAYACRHSA